MSRIFQPLLFLIAQSTHQMLARQLEFVMAENKMLRERVPRKQIRLRESERGRLMKLGEALGPGVRYLITVVHYSTYRRWIRTAEGREPVASGRGRPPTAEAMRELILRIAKEMGCGYTKVIGELKKLGIRPPSRTTVKKIMREGNLDPGPRRGPGSWDEFLKIHADTLWQIDFFSKHIWTARGLRQYFVLVFLHVGSRKVFVTEATRNPNTAWMQRQAKVFLQYAEQESLGVGIVMRDNDGKFMDEFDEIIEDGTGPRIVRIAVRAPNQNAFIERWVQSIKHECLDHFIVFGEDHFNYLITEYVEYYMTERPHQGLDNRLIDQASLEDFELSLDDKPPDVAIHCRERLGGLLRHYYRAAA